MRIFTEEEMGTVAAKIAESINPKLTAQEEAFFIAGFQECAKWMLLKDKQRNEYPLTPDECIPPTDVTGRYVVVDDFNETVNLVSDTDGIVSEFSTLAAAKEAAEDCQNGIVVQLG